MSAWRARDGCGMMQSARVWQAPLQGASGYQDPVLAMRAGFGRGVKAAPACRPPMRLPSGVRMKAIRSVTRQGGDDRHAARDEDVAGVVDVVPGVGEMAEITAAGEA